MTYKRHNLYDTIRFMSIYEFASHRNEASLPRRLKCQSVIKTFVILLLFHVHLLDDVEKHGWLCLVYGFQFFRQFSVAFLRPSLWDLAGVPVGHTGRRGRLYCEKETTRFV